MLQIKKDYTIGLSYTIFAFYVFFSITAQRSVIGNITLMLFIGSIFIFCAKKLRFHFSTYFMLEILFILYSFFQLRNNIPINSEAHIAHIMTLLIGTLFNIALYNFIRLSGDYKRIISVYVKSSFLGFIFLIVLFFQSILNGRFTAANFIFIFGGQGATSLAYIAGFALFYSAWLYLEDPTKKKAYGYILFFTIIIMLTGTRKTLVMIAATIFFIPLFKSEIRLNKVIKHIILFGSLAFITYLLVINVSILYEIIGHRIENVMANLLNGEIADGSIETRNRLIDEAYHYFYQRSRYGWGLDNFRTVLSRNQLYAHNNYLEVLVSSGYVGGIIFFSKYCFLFIKFLLVYKHNIYRKNINSFLILFIIIIILEYWQVTLIFRTHTIPFIFMLGYINNISKENLLWRKHTNEISSKKH